MNVKEQGIARLKKEREFREADSMSVEEREGVAAAQRGDPPDSNPHRPDTREFAEWANGHMEASMWLAYGLDILQLNDQ